MAGVPMNTGSTMIDASRHVPLRDIAWSADEASVAIREIVADALAHFDPVAFWPVHPQDDESKDGHSSVYIGAAGMIWALDYLQRTGAAQVPYDFRPHLDRLLAATRAEMADYGLYSNVGSLLLGDLGTALVLMRLAPSAATHAVVEARARTNTDLPVRELMWGMPGSMLACLAMAEMTGEPRWRAIFEAQAPRLLGDLEETECGPIWVLRDGHEQRFLGAVHGFAGNMVPLLRGWRWLSEAQRTAVIGAVSRTLAANAWHSDIGTSWRAQAVRGRPPVLCQHCHGAPGMVTTFADAPFSTPELDALLLEGGRFTWAAGPLAKGSNLCHGTGGNGYAFLKLFRRTGNTVWLARARAFAMTAIAQCREARAELGRGRFSLWTGDVGLAIYLADCINATARFPTVDVV
jgi:hypothetical protein